MYNFYDQICLVLFGETGHGKSTLGNAILGKEIFKVNDTMQSVTREIYGCQGTDKSKNLFVIDTPGINDSEGKDNESLKKIAKYLKRRNDLKGIVVVLNYCLQTALQNSAKKAFKTIFRIFKSKNIYTNIIVAFTHFFSGRKPPKRNEQGELIEKIFRIFKENYFEMFEQECPINSLPFYFLEIDSIEGLDNESQMEINNMIATIYNREPINPSIIKVKDDYNIKDELVSTRFVENIVRFEGDYIIKKISKYKKTIIKYYDSKPDNILDELVEEYERKVLNSDLIEQKKQLQIQKLREKQMQEQLQKEIENQERIRMEREKELNRLREEQKRKEEERKNLERRVRLEIEREEQRRRREKEKRIRIRNKIKYYIDNPRYENDSSSVYELYQTWSYGLLSSPSYDDIEIELLRTVRLDKEDQPFSYVTGRINGSFSGKVILGWKLINRHNNENGGSWKRIGKILGTSNYDFSFTSCYWRSLHWTLELYGIELPYDYYDIIEDDEDDLY